jgi:hypothetical protein
MRNIFKIVLFLVTACIAIPVTAKDSRTEYSDYALRTKFVEAIAVAYERSAEIEKYYVNHDVLPLSDKEPGLRPAGVLPASVKSTSVGPGAAITVTFTDTIPQLGGKSIVFSPVISPDQHFEWKCVAPDIPAEYLSKPCR